MLGLEPVWPEGLVRLHANPPMELVPDLLHVTGLHLFSSMQNLCLQKEQ